MKTTICVFFLVLGLVAANHKPIVPKPISLGQLVDNTVWPCDSDYYVTTGFANQAVGVYMRFDFNYTEVISDSETAWIGAGFIPSHRVWSSQCKLTSANTACQAWAVCGLNNNTYVTIDGGKTDKFHYNFLVTSLSVLPKDLAPSNTAKKVNRDRPFDSDLKGNFPEYYDHYFLNVPQYYLGESLTVNISYVQTNTSNYPELRVNYQQLAVAEDANCALNWCRNSNGNGNACMCKPSSTADSCNVTVAPCFFKAGTYYFSVRIPNGASVNYTITAATSYPYILPMALNTYYQYQTDVVQSAHHQINITSVPANSHLRVTISNVVGGIVSTYVDKFRLAGGKDGCGPAVSYCKTAWACNIVIPGCRLTNGSWYIAVDTDSAFSYRLPVTYTIYATIEADAQPQTIVPGQVVASNVGENLYNFYKLDVPSTVDTWLYAELYVNTNNSEVLFMMNPSYAVGDEWDGCYPVAWNRNWTCLTGGANREACYFHIRTCELGKGSIYFTVFGHNQSSYIHQGGIVKNTFYAINAEYTLRVSLDEPRAILNNVSYSETVYAEHYQHYYISYTDVVPGEYLTVDFSNVENGQITGFVYPNDLAGKCPCYKNLVNCTTSNKCTLWVDTCLFTNGVWYFSALGWTTTGGTTKTPIGYTLTAIRHPAPPIKTISLGAINAQDIGWNESHHYVVDGSSLGPNDNLIVKVILDQDLGNKYSLHTIVAFNRFPSLYEDNVTHHCYEQHCFTNAGSDSYCTIRIPYCENYALTAEKHLWYISVYTLGWGNTDPRALYTLRTYVERDPVKSLISGYTEYARVQNFAYNHYSIVVPSNSNSSMYVELYSNNDQDMITLRMNYNQMAGYWPCLNYLKPYECNTTTSCVWILDPCHLPAGTYYFSVYGIAKRNIDVRYKSQYYDQSVEYTFTVTLYNTVTDLTPFNPMAGYVYPGTINHYHVVIPTLTPFQEFVIETANVRHGTVRTFVKKVTADSPELAGPCPCYKYTWDYSTPDADAAGAPSIGSITWPYCSLSGKEGRYYISVMGATGDTGATTMYITPTAYTIQVKLRTPAVFTNYTVGQKWTTQTLNDQYYAHYQLNVASGVSGPQQLQIFLSNIKRGAVDLYLNPVVGAGDKVPTEANGAFCYVAKRTCGGSECQWVAPECTFNVSQVWWLTVRARTPSFFVNYDLETRLKPVTTISLLAETNYTNIYGFTDHYKLTNLGVTTGQYLIVELKNVNSKVDLYINGGSLAGPSSCGSCVHGIQTWPASSTCNSGYCKYTVPSCFFYNAEWYLAVVPSGLGQRTNYTLKVTKLGSIEDTTPITAPFTPSSFTLNKIEQWKMFTVNVVSDPLKPTRLIINGTWGAGTAKVTMFVNQTSIVGGENCMDWWCTSDGANPCLYILESCCTISGTYRIGFHQTIDGTRDVTVQVDTWPEHGTSTLALGSTFTAAADSDGVGERNYKFFKMNVPASVSLNKQTIVLNLTISDTTPAGQLNVFLRPNYPAGSGSCYSNTMTGAATKASPYVVELPYCNWITADWFIGLYNPAPYMINPLLSKPVWFNLQTYTYGVRPTTLGAWDNNTIDINTWVHWSFSVSASDIVYNKNTLRVEAYNTDSTTGANPISLYLNYGDLAGAAGTGGLTCTGTCVGKVDFPNLIIDVPSCSLRVGTYYAALKVSGTMTNFGFRASINTQNYILQSGNPSVLGEYAFVPMTVTLTDANTNAGNSVDYYRINVPVTNVGATTQLLANITNTGGGSVKVTMIYGCKTWSATTGGSALIADQPGLGPCDLQTGEYLFIIQQFPGGGSPFKGVNYTVTAYLRDAINPEQLNLTGKAGIDNDAIYAGYHNVWFFTVPAVTQSAVTVSLETNVTCGSIEAWLNYGRPGGPGCYLATCSGTGTACKFFLDTCQTLPGDYYVTIRAQTQDYASTNLYQPVKYEVWATMTSVYNDTAVSPFTWSWYNATYGINQYYVLDLETYNPGDWLQFEAWGVTGTTIKVVHESRITTSSSYATLSGDNCPGALAGTCTVAGGNPTATCSFRLSQCQVKNGRWYMLLTTTDWTRAGVRATRIPYDVPHIWPDVVYMASVGDMQYYKIVPINNTENGWFARFKFYNVWGGSVSATLAPVTTGWTSPVLPNTVGAPFSCVNPLSQTCTADENNNCTLEIHPCMATYPVYYLTIAPVTYKYSNLSVDYSFWYNLYPKQNKLNVWVPLCDNVFETNYTFYQLNPQVSNAEEILLVNISSSQDTEMVGLYLRQTTARLPTSTCNDNYRTWPASPSNSWTSISTTKYIAMYECAYTDFHIGVKGVKANNANFSINYLIHATTYKAPVITLQDGVSTYNCGGRIYFKFNVNNTAANLFQVQVWVEGGGNAKVYVNTGGLAAENCAVRATNCSGSCVIWFWKGCDLVQGVHYITVDSGTTPFTIQPRTVAHAVTALTSFTPVIAKNILDSSDFDATTQVYSFVVNTTDIFLDTDLTFNLTYDNAIGVGQVATIYYVPFGATGTIGTAGQCIPLYTTTAITGATTVYTVKNCVLKAGTYYAYVKNNPAKCGAPSLNYVIPNNAQSYWISAGLIRLGQGAVRINNTVNYTDSVMSNSPVGNHYWIPKSPLNGGYWTVRVMQMLAPVSGITPSSLQVRYQGDHLSTVSGCVNVGCSIVTNDASNKFHKFPATYWSCVFKVDNCYYNTYSNFFFQVVPITSTGACAQPYPITYTIQVREEAPTKLVAANTVSDALMDNYDKRHYLIDTTTTQSVVARLTVLPGNDGPLTFVVEDNPCPALVVYRWTKTCTTGQYCDIEIPTLQAHPERNMNQFWVSVTGNRANFTIGYNQGTPNCGTPQWTANSFCDAKVVNYPTWNWATWQRLDDEARSTFNWLYTSFLTSRDWPCYAKCNESLRWYACHTSFRACDSNGFYLPVCRSVCDLVVYQCQNWFDTVLIQSMNCTSHRYSDPYYGNCTGVDTKVPYPPDSFVNILGAASGASSLAPISALVMMLLAALFVLA